MGKARSFRLTSENETRLEELVKISKLENANKVFNEIIENYHFYKKNEKLLGLIKQLFEELKGDK